MKVVIDTNILISALRSRQGASFKLFSLVGKGLFEPVLSLPLFLEYEEIVQRQVSANIFSADSGDKMLNFIAYHFSHQELHYKWCPMLNDLKDEMVLETLFNSRAKFLITYNKKDFSTVTELHDRLLTAQEFLILIGELP